MEIDCVGQIETEFLINRIETNRIEIYLPLFVFVTISRHRKIIRASLELVRYWQSVSEFGA